MKPPLLLALPLLLANPSPAAEPLPSAAVAERFATLALDCVGREYPNKIAHAMNSDADVKPPRELTPAFFGCYDWHSSVHGHWLLARLARTYPGAPFAAKARQALAKDLTPEKIAAEARYLNAPGRALFERPYGLAWLLQLSAELHEWDDADARRWAKTLEPLEAAAVARLKEWMPKLTNPIRIGEHNQTAFSFGLILDWARERKSREMEELVTRRAGELYLKDRGCPLVYEPSGEDFLSPCLAEADLIRRILPRPAFAAWLGSFLPQIPLDGSSAWLPIGIVTDPTDGKLAHLSGLNLTRAWMLDGIAQSLPEGDPRVASLRAARAAHAEAGLRAVSGEHYEGGHWLGTFAVYLVTGRGLR